jgi:ferredoxin
MPLRVFRPAVRLTCFLVLIYGGFALRQNPTDYRDMIGRRKTQAAVMNLSETAPVMRYDDRMVHLPSAPCRFAPDGGYVQGCNMELAQRFLQIDFRRVQRGDPSEVNAMGSILASTLVFLVLAIVLSRAACGWLCPLSSMGELFNFIRRRTGRSPIRPSPRVRNAYLYSGLGLSGLGLAMSALYPYIDANGNFLGCKIPLYPFCKLCPSQQLCPVAGSGPAGYPPLPGLEWAFGLFRYGCLVLLALFVVSTLAGRRLWCRFCPMGMISGVFNRGGLFALRKQPEKCNRCGMCAEVCPMDIRRVRDERSGTHVSSYDCVLCLQCIDACPRDRCLSLEHHGITIVESRYRGLP